MKHFTLFILISFWIGLCSGQQPTVLSHPEGTFILIPSSDLMYQNIQVQKRIKGKKTWKDAGKLAPPESFQELRRRYQASKDQFPIRISDETSVLPKVWDFIQSRKPLENLPFFRLPAVQIAMGAAIIDAKVQTGKTYEYRFSIEGLPNEVSSIQYQENHFGHGTLIPLSGSKEAPFPKAEWITERVDFLADFKAFRKSPNEKEFTQIYPVRQKAPEKDSLTLIMTDTSHMEDGVYEYYIIPLDFMGNEGRPSPVIRAAKFTTKTQPMVVDFRAISSPNKGGLQLNWILMRPERVYSVKLYRSRNYTDQFEFIAELSALDTMYLDPVSDPMESYYYYLEINDFTRKQIKSATIFGIYKGTVKADPPMLLTAKEEDNGVELSWEKGGDNTRGYYLYRATGHQGEFIQISPFLKGKENHSFVDTTALEGGKIYSYAVRAESESYLLSDFSERVSLRSSNPTTIAPPLHIQSRLDRNRVFITWEDLMPRNPYLEGYEVYRQEHGKELELMTRTPLPFRQNYWYDSTIVPGNAYTYKVRALDSFGAESLPSKGSRINIPLPTFPQNLGLRKTTEGIELSWSPKSLPPTYQLRIERAEESLQGPAIVPTDKHTSSYLDQNVTSGRLYSYRITYTNVTGEILYSSDPVSIRF